MYFIDTETCGLCGPAVLIQYAQDDGEIELHDVWKRPASETMQLIEDFLTDDICMFNMSFDAFQLAKLYTMLAIWGRDSIPEDHIPTLLEIEPLARFGPCIRPKGCLDLMLVARRTKYQSMMDRKDIRIRRVPAVIADELAEHLGNSIQLDEIYFSRRKDKYAPKWKVYDIEGRYDFKDVVLKFSASTALKNLAIHALNIKEDDLLRYHEVEVNRSVWPGELPFAPFAKAVDQKHPPAIKRLLKGRKSWPNVIHHHINHWAYDTLARRYAKNDIVYTRGLYEHFNKPEVNDDDSVLAWMVGVVRWRGFSIDVEGIKALREEALKLKSETPIAPRQAFKWITEGMDDVEIMVMDGSTKKRVLEEVAALDLGQPSERARQVLEARKSGKEVELYDKLLAAGRFHASFKVIGTLSSRMSGTDKLNAQGIKKTKNVRRCFPLKDEGFNLSGGDFSGFEVVLAEAAYNDPSLRADLLSGKKIHALFGQFVFPHMTYEEILKSEGTADDKYTKSKSAVFAMFYGGEGPTLKDRLGVPLEVADEAYAKFVKRYPQVGVARKKVFNAFCSMRQPNGIGTRVEWHEPEDSISSMFGFKRFFTLENRICKSLFELASDPPKKWLAYKVKVVRRDRLQTASGALRSALYATAFSIQSAAMRAAANHVIQSSGAQITKKLQRNLWDLQPVGVNDWKILTLNVHDEVLTPCIPELVPVIKKVVTDTVDSFKPQVPLLKIDWKETMGSWAEK